MRVAVITGHMFHACKEEDLNIDRIVTSRRPSGGEVTSNSHFQRKLHRHEEQKCFLVGMFKAFAEGLIINGYKLCLLWRVLGIQVKLHDRTVVLLVLLTRWSDSRMSSTFRFWASRWCSEAYLCSHVLYLMSCDHISSRSALPASPLLPTCVQVVPVFAHWHRFGPWGWCEEHGAFRRSTPLLWCSNKRFAKIQAWSQVQ